MGYLYGYSEQWICQIVVSYAVFFARIGMYLVVDGLFIYRLTCCLTGLSKIRFLKGAELEKHTPEKFREIFPKGEHHLFDVTQFPIQISHCPVVQKLSYSKYKHRNTVTLLAGTAPDSYPEYLAPHLMGGNVG